MKQELYQDYPGSVRWQHCLAPHTDNIQKPTKWPDRLLGGVIQLSESQLNETTSRYKSDATCKSCECEVAWLTDNWAVNRAHTDQTKIMQAPVYVYHNRPWLQP